MRARAEPFDRDPLVAATARMRLAGQPELAVRCLALHLERLVSGASGMLAGEAISALDQLPSASDLAPLRPVGERALARLVVVKLNGGLGTSMGLDRAKSLLVVREGLNFLDLIARQVDSLRRQAGVRAPLVLLNSFRTEADSLRHLAGYPELGDQEVPVSLLQHQVPRLLSDSLMPASWPADPDLEWCPPGHGDLYAALASSGLLRRLLAGGLEYAFVSNADNLGAVVDPALLGYLVSERLDLLLEAADRTASDRKGGHLCRLAGGRLGLREAAQCPPEEVEEFQDVMQHRYFNTNSLWLHLPSLARLLEEHDGVLPLATIVNRKPLDPRDPSTPQVVQLETAMGAALSLFPHGSAVRVPRRRFSPVKTTADLLAVRSDAYRLGADGQLALDPRRQTPPVVLLDDRYYRLLDDLEARFPEGPPSLLECNELRVEGDVRFGAGVAARGRVRVVAPDGGATVPDNTLLEGEIRL